MINQQDALGAVVLIKRVTDDRWIVMGPRTPIWTVESELQATRMVRERWFNYILQVTSHGRVRRTDNRTMLTEQLVKKAFSGGFHVTY